MLELPPTIRLPRIDELPNHPEVFELLREREKANIEEGFIIQNNESQDLPFTFYAEINIDNSRLASLFAALSLLLPDDVCCIYSLYGEEPNFSAYQSKSTLLLAFSAYTLELTQDCFLEFGFIYHTEKELIEVYIKDSKYIQCWGNDEVVFRQIMHDFQLLETPTMNFIDEFPKTVEPLSTFNDNARSAEQVIAELELLFRTSGIHVH